MTWAILLYYCTVQNVCYLEKPEPLNIYATHEACVLAIEQKGRNILTNLFEEDDTDIAIWCDDAKKSLLMPPEYPKFDGSDNFPAKVLEEMQEYEQKTRP